MIDTHDKTFVHGNHTQLRNAGLPQRRPPVLALYGESIASNRLGILSRHPHAHQAEKEGAR